MNRILTTSGTGFFEEKEWSCPDITDDEIKVKSIMTGICRSDIDMMNGKFNLLPVNMHGHEGLGQILEVGKNIGFVKVGDFVATRGEPAYADVYTVRDKEFVVVPDAEPKYILEPVACGINLVRQPLALLKERSGPGKRLLLLGSGFLAWVAYHAISEFGLEFEVDVVGSANKDIWGDTLKSVHSGTYDAIIDISSKTTIFDNVIYNNNALIVLGSQKQVTTDFETMLWKAVTIIFPSPRTDIFYYCMMHAVDWIQSGRLCVDEFWTNGYNRDTYWQQAFSDSNDRSREFSRGYIYWSNNGT